MNYFDTVVSLLAKELPGQDVKLLRYYALLALVHGENTTLEDVHDAWSAWRTETNPGHKSLIPFEELTRKVQELDMPYRDAIRRVARKRRPS